MRGTELIPLLRAVAEERKSDKIFLRADGAIPYEGVMQVMGALNASGFRDIGLVTEQGGPAVRRAGRLGPAAMRTGTKISAAGHGALVALALFGLPWFGPREREAIRVTEVSFVSEAEFAAAQSAARRGAARPRTRRPRGPAAAAAPAPDAAPEPASRRPRARWRRRKPPAPEPERPRRHGAGAAAAAAPPRSRPVQRVEPNHAAAARGGAAIGSIGALKRRA